jgi:PKD repeat protein
VTTLTFGLGGTYATASDATYAFCGGHYADPSYPFSDDLTLVQVGYCYERGTFPFWGGTIVLGGLGGKSLTITSDTPSNGDPTVGHIWDLGNVQNNSMRWYSTYGDMTVRGMNIRNVNATLNPTLSMISVFLDTSIYGTYVDGNVIQGTKYGNVVGCLEGAPTGKIFQFTRNVVSSDDPTNRVGFLWSCGSNATSSVFTVENNTFNAPVDCAYNGHTTTITFRNNYATIFNHNDAFTGYNNKSVTNSGLGWKAGGSNNSYGIVTANEFISQDPTSAQFMKLKSSGTLYSAGIAPVIVTKDIAGFDIPNLQGNYPVGAHILDVPPIARFTSAAGALTKSGYPIVFTDTSILNPTSWAWTFGDEATSSSENPTHQYAANGTYTVTLTVSNIYGTDTTSHTYTYKGAVVERSPQAMLQISDDGGFTWGSERWENIGKIGEYRTRMHWHRLGSSRNRVFRLVISDPVKRALIGCRVTTEGEVGG